jgi:NlpC/P60 family
VKKFGFILLALLPALGGLVSCSNQVKARKPVSYRFEHGRTALLKNGTAYAPRSAPLAVKRAIAAGNRLQGKPYKWGGGHARHDDSGYDCSGTVSYVLREAGLLRGSMPSSGYFRYGKKGEGRWITVYIRKGHVFLTVAGLRLDTGGPGNRTGPRWKPETRQSVGHVMRHPSGL